MRLLIKMAALSCLALPAIAFGQSAGGQLQPSTNGNAACWNYLSNPEVRPDITCTPLSISLLTKLRYSTRQEIEAVMKEPGKVLDDGTLRYLSNYDFGHSSGSGSVNFSFDDAGRTIIIDADIEILSQWFSGDEYMDAEYLWNADRKFFCSDIPDGAPNCSYSVLQGH